MYKGLSPGLAALMGLTVAGATTAEAAPLTGHTVTIKLRDSGTSTQFFEKTTTVDALNPEVTAADDSLFDVNDVLDIGADSITMFTDGIGEFEIFDVELDFSASTSLSFLNASISIDGSIGNPVFQVLSERILIEDVRWNFGSLHISGIQANSEPSSNVPEPGALAGLGAGLVGMAGAGLARRKKKATDKKDE